MNFDWRCSCMIKKIVAFILVALVVLCAVPLAYAESEAGATVLDENTFSELWMDFYRASFEVYDLNTAVKTYPSVVFGYDSNGVPYANGKKYYYINYGDRDLSACYATALEKYQKVLTPELAQRMVEDLHVPGGPDVELIRRGSDGNWYRLFLVRPGGVLPSDVKSIHVDGNRAHVDARLRVDVIDLEDVGRNDYPYDKGLRFDFTVDLVYTDDGWRMSGGDVFDYIRDYAYTSPETGDENGVRAARLGAAAVLAAAVPAVMLTVSRRKKKYIDI